MWKFRLCPPPSRLSGRGNGTDPNLNLWNVVNKLYTGWGHCNWNPKRVKQASRWSVVLVVDSPVRDGKWDWAKFSVIQVPDRVVPSRANTSCNNAFSSVSAECLAVRVRICLLRQCLAWAASRRFAVKLQLEKLEKIWWLNCGWN